MKIINIVKYLFLLIVLLSLSSNTILADTLVWRINFSDGLQASFVNESGASGSPLFTTGVIGGTGVIGVEEQFGSANQNYIRWDFPTPITPVDFDTMYLQFDMFCPAGGLNYWDLILSGTCDPDSSEVTAEEISYSWFNDCTWECANNSTQCSVEPTFNSNSFFPSINMTFVDLGNIYQTTSFYQQGNQPTSFGNRTNEWKDNGGDWETTAVRCLYISDTFDPDAIFNLHFANMELWNRTVSIVPDFTIVQNGSVCYNSTTKEAEFNFNWVFPDGTDESDLLYGIDITNWKKIDTYYHEEFINLNVDSCKENWDFFKSDNYVSNVSVTDSKFLQNALFLLPSSLIINSNTHFLRADESIFDASDRLCDGRLYTPTGVDKFQINPSQSVANDLRTNLILSMSDVTNFTVIYKDTSFNDVINFTLSTHDGNLTLYRNNARIKDISYTINELFVFTFNFNETKDNYSIEWGNQEASSTFTENLNMSVFRGLEFVNGEDNTNVWSLAQVTVLGFSEIETPSFSSVKTEQIILNSTGQFLFQFFLSDPDNKDLNKFKKFELQMTVPQCTEFYDPLSSDTKEALRTLKVSNKQLCESFDNSVMAEEGLDFSFCTLLIWITAFVSVGIAVLVWLVFMDLSFMFLAWSITEIVGSFFVEYPIGFKVVIGFIFALSLAIIFSKMFSGGNLGDGGQRQDG